ncbi:DUF2442 domain-containing protein [Odoribacter lunatus]|uniref:DUF2442 domain-containing protein n=1 Tax=Odoribacter lunatus TaxID=2941335 RepID=UPI00203CC9F2|nr:DUF2442 domain-containing protein [Odoribacter lunatus]
MKIDVVKVWVDDIHVNIETSDGQIKSEKIADYYRLRNATAEQRQHFEYDNMGIHWSELDEDLSYEGFFHSKEVNSKSELYTFFKSYPEINVSKLARRMGISQSLMASYICGVKKPSAERLKEIETAVRSLGQELASVSL